MRKMAGWILVVAVVGLGTGAGPGRARAEGLFTGIESGPVVPLGRTARRLDVGGTLAPFLGYMYDENFGVIGQLQIPGFPNDNRPGILDQDSTWIFGAHVGPRLALPFTLGDLGLEPYGTFQAGIFSGLVGGSPVTRSSFGFSTGGGLNLLLTDSLRLGAFANYNQLDQRIAPRRNVEYLSTGLSFTWLPAVEPAVRALEAPPAEEAPETPRKRKIVLRGVTFEFDRADLRAEDQATLDEVFELLEAQENISIIAEGHTDSLGSDSYNLRLSQQRAAAVKIYLVKRGIAPNRIQIIGLGESRPVADNESESGRAENRRVELRLRQ